MASLNSDGAWCSMLFSISIKKLPAAYVLLSYGLNSKATSSVPTTIFSINVLLAPSITETVLKSRSAKQWV